MRSRSLINEPNLMRDRQRRLFGWSTTPKKWLNTGVFLLLVGLPASAHRLNYTNTEIVWQPDEGVLELTHSIHLDDALQLLARLGAPAGDLDLPTTARLLVYMDEHFAVATQEARLELEPMGAHIDGDLLYVYRRSQQMPLPTRLDIRCSLLRDIPRPSDTPLINQVNWRIGPLVRSLACDPDRTTNALQLQKQAQPTP